MRKPLFDEKEFYEISEPAFRRVIGSSIRQDMRNFINRAIISAVRENLEKVRLGPAIEFTGDFHDGFKRCCDIVDQKIDARLTEIDEMGKELK